jgi:hypothetical protein
VLALRRSHLSRPTPWANFPFRSAIVKQRPQIVGPGPRSLAVEVLGFTILEELPRSSPLGSSCFRTARNVGDRDECTCLTTSERTESSMSCEQTCGAAASAVTRARQANGTRRPVGSRANKFDRRRCVGTPILVTARTPGPRAGRSALSAKPIRPQWAGACPVTRESRPTLLASYLADLRSACRTKATA